MTALLTRYNIWVMGDFIYDSVTYKVHLPWGC